MTDKQSEALQLADCLERMSLSTQWDKKAAAELRRLHQANAELVELALEEREACAKLCEAGVAAEREACANVAAWILKMPENDVSAAIRARGQV